MIGSRWARACKSPEVSLWQIHYTKPADLLQVNKMVFIMETPKITKVEFELDAVSGELRTMHDLLNIFANWFEETHKTDMLNRERTERLVSQLWNEAPMYSSLITALFASLTGLEKEVDAVLEAEIARVGNGC